MKKHLVRVAILVAVSFAAFVGAWVATYPDKGDPKNIKAFKSVGSTFRPGNLASELEDMKDMQFAGNPNPRSSGSGKGFGGGGGSAW